MKRSLISLAVGAACATAAVSSWAADVEDPTVYGRLDISLQSYEDESTTPASDYWEVKSHASRFGVKGKAKLNDTMSAVYKYELEINPDSSKSTDGNVDFLKARNQYVGLTCDKMGTLTLGRMDTPLKSSQGKVDLFGDHLGDIKNIMKGENRQANLVQYESPKITDVVTVKVALEQGENVALDGGTEADDGIGDATSISVSYHKDGLYLALANDSSINKTDLSRFVATYKADNFQVGVLFQSGESSTPGSNADYDGMLVSGAYTIGANTIKAQIGQAENNNVDSDLIAVGVDHKLGKKTKAYAEYTVVTTEGTPDTDETIFGFGIQHKF